MSEYSHSDDELLSSHLDGDLTAEEGARLEQRLAAEPSLSERLDELRAAAALASSPVTPLADVDANRLIAAALASSATAANVTDLATAPSRRRVWPTRIATAAAGVVALTLSVTALQNIDTGDGGDSDAGSADTASTDDSGFGDDEGDATEDGLAADLSQESMIVPDDADAMGGADSGRMDDTADDSPEVDEGTNEFQNDVVEAAMAYAAGRLRIFERDASFDPFEEDLGEFASTQALALDLSNLWTAYRSAQSTATTTTLASGDGDDDSGGESHIDRADLLDAASFRLVDFNAESCPELADLIIDYFAGEEVVAADYASATVDGSEAVVGLFQLPGDDAVVLLIDLATCESLDVPLN